MTEHKDDGPHRGNEMSKQSWSKLYDKHFPHNTDGASRHVKCIAADMLRPKRSSVRKLLIEAGYDPDHMADSMEATVIALWEARAELASLNSTPKERSDD